MNKTLSYYPPINRLHLLNQHLFLSAPSSAINVTYQTCQLQHSQFQIRSISDKEIEEVIPADFFRTDRSFDFSLCRLYKERVLSIKQCVVIVSSSLLMILLQSISLDLEIITIFLQILT